MKRSLYFTAITVFLLQCFPLPFLRAGETPDGNSSIRRKAGPSEIVITTTSRVAGAIHSITWNGREFIDSADHGRQLQCAVNCDVDGEFHPETFNPTEAGSVADGAGGRSSSKLLEFRAVDGELESRTQMAFWLKPDGSSGGFPAKNTTILSGHVVSKRVRIGYKNLDHVIACEFAFTIPADEKHTYAQFESPTGYMPAEFNQFRTFNPATGELKPIDEGPGEQAFPLVFSTESGGHAMGVFSPDQPSRGAERAGYGRFSFKHAKVTKWNCVFRVRDANGIGPGPYRFRVFVVVGSLDDVRQSLGALAKEFHR